MQAPDIPLVQYLNLPGKEDCAIAYTFDRLQTAHSGSDAQSTWLVFINGLGLSQAFWQPTLKLIQEHVSRGEVGKNASTYTTTYDRYGQGLSRPAKGELLRPHDLLDSVEDLHDFLRFAFQSHIARHTDKHAVQTIVVAHSIGVPLARFYLDKYGGEWSISGVLFLDSNMANVDMVNLLPDPDAPDFNEDELPEDTNTESLRWSRENIRKMFSPNVPNVENLDRSTLPALLPHADRPVLRGAKGQQLNVTVVAHDPETFAVESLKICTKGLTEQHVEPAWHNYNLGLLKLNGCQDSASDQIVVAKGSSHFVQRDNPHCVADEICKLIRKGC